MSNTVLKTGCLAYYDTIESGLVPCEVLAITKTVDDLCGVRRYAKIRITENRYAYRRDDVVDGISAAFVIPRGSVYYTPGVGSAHIRPYAIIHDPEVAK